MVPHNGAAQIDPCFLCISVCSHESTDHRRSKFGAQSQSPHSFSSNIRVFEYDEESRHYWHVRLSIREALPLEVTWQRFSGSHVWFLCGIGRLFQQGTSLWKLAHGFGPLVLLGACFDGVINLRDVRGHG